MSPTTVAPHTLTVDPPTSAPLGEELTKRALGYAFEPRCLERILDHYARLRVLDRREFPRLETILDVVRRVLGVEALRDVLSDIRHPPPDDMHGFFAAHLDHGGRHITANFDDAVERSRVTATGAEMVHFHGSFAADPSGESLGATLRNIQSGFPSAISDDLQKILTAPGVETVVFVGYSGYDAFDVSPFLRSLEPGHELAGEKVVWVRFRRTGDDLVIVRGDSPNPRVADALEGLGRAGASCVDLEGDPRAVLAAFAVEWGLPAVALMSTQLHGNKVWTVQLATSGDERRRASLELYAMMGLRSEVRRLFSGRAPANAYELEFAADAMAADGRYRDAAELWRNAIPGDTPVERARREQQVASCWWREGRLLKAHHHLRRELLRRSSGVHTRSSNPASSSRASVLASSRSVFAFASLIARSLRVLATTTLIPRSCSSATILSTPVVASDATTSVAARLPANSSNASTLVATRPADLTSPPSTIATSQKSRCTSSPNARTSLLSSMKAGARRDTRQRRIRALSTPG
jgi:hypothetical protein